MDNNVDITLEGDDGELFENPLGDNRNSSGRTPQDSARRSKRRRKPVSCQFCRGRKLKCDKNHPCSTCIRRNGGVCDYGTVDTLQRPSHSAGRTILKNNTVPETVTAHLLNPSTVPQEKPGFSELVIPGIQRPIYNSRAATKLASPPAKNSVGAMLSVEEFAQGQRQNRQAKLNSENSTAIQDRLDKMEQLILTMLASKSEGTPSDSGKASPDDVLGSSESNDDIKSDLMEDLGESLGMLKLDQRGKSIYHGDTHWVYLFHEMSEVQEFFKNLKKNDDGVGKNNESFCNTLEGGRSQSSSVMATGGFSYSGAEVLESIPDRATCEFLVERYFHSVAPLLDMVNRSQFELTFHQFWANPQETEILWVAQLLCMLILSLESYGPCDVPENLVGLLDKRRDIWSQGVELCSSIGKITSKPGLINVRVLLMWMFAQSPGADWHERGWCTLALVIRVAQSMGLHRDPKYFVLSPFEMEERRKIWSVIMYLDAYCAVGQGLPMAINFQEQDTMEPANLDVKDMVATLGQVPIPRDLFTTPTSTSFMIFQHRLTRLRINAYTVNLGIKQSYASYKELWRLDAEVRNFYNKLPRYLRQRCTEKTSKRVAGSSIDPLVLQGQRFIMECDYLKTLVVLHRVYSQKASINNGYMASRKVTTECSIQLIELHQWLLCTEDGKAVLKRFMYPLAATMFPYFMHASIVVSVRLMSRDAMSSEDRADLFDAVEKCEEIIGGLAQTGAFSPMLLNLSKSIFQYTKRAGSMSEEERAQYERTMNSVSDSEKTVGMNRLPGVPGAGKSHTFEYFGDIRGTGQTRSEKALILGLDTSDVDFRAENLFSPDRHSNSSSAQTGSSNLDDTSPQSLNTMNSQKSNYEVSPDVFEYMEDGGAGQPNANNFPTEEDLSFLQMKSPAGGSNIPMMDSIFGDEVLKMQQVMGSDVWDNFLKDAEHDQNL